MMIFTLIEFEKKRPCIRHYSLQQVLIEKIEDFLPCKEVL